MLFQHTLILMKGYHKFVVIEAIYPHSEISKRQHPFLLNTDSLYVYPNIRQVSHIEEAIKSIILVEKETQRE